jgi:quinoprotein glucose dehydrogenase
MWIWFIGVLLGAMSLVAAPDSTLRALSGFTVEPVANETTLSNVVSFSIDEGGRIFVTETHREVELSYPKDDATLRSVQDRAEFLATKVGKLSFLTNRSERVLLLDDKNNDGQIDSAKVFAKNFNRAVDGLAGGILARRGDVYFACVPDLWLLRDNSRQSLHTGFGVHLRNPTHNLRNPTLGPDGRLYFTMGDQGFNVQSREGVPLAYPEAGAILRCEMDGAKLEVFARGFKNPQGLAFNELGDLFAVDGEQLLHVIEGMHATNFAAITNFQSPVNAFCHYPGSGLPDSFRGCFFVADSNVIASIKLRPKALAYEVVGSEPFILGASANHFDFGTKPGLYFSEFRGRIYRAFSSAPKPPSATNLLQKLTHPDERVRLENQYNVAAEENGVGQLTALIINPTNLTASIHAVWALGLAARNKNPAALQSLIFAVRSKEPEVRAQAAKCLGDIANPQSGPALVPLLNDKEPRVQLFAVTSLARLRFRPAQSPLTLLSGGAEIDQRLRFAILRALDSVMIPAK